MVLVMGASSSCGPIGPIGPMERPRIPMDGPIRSRWCLADDALLMVAVRFRSLPQDRFRNDNPG